MILPLLSVCQTNYTISSLAKQEISVNQILEDTARARGLRELAKNYRKEAQYDSAISKLQEALFLVDFKHQLDLASKIYQAIAQVHILNGQYDIAISYMNKRLEILAEKIDPKIEAGIYNDLSVTFYYKGDFHTATIYQLKAIRIYEDQSDENFLMKSYNNLGLLYQKNGQPVKATKALKKAVALSNKLSDLDTKGFAYNNLVLVFSDLQLYDSALFYAFASERIKLSTKSPTIATTYQNIGEILIKQKRYNEALSFMQQALAINQQYKNQNSIVHNYIGIGNCLILLNRPIDALGYFNDALRVARELGALDLVIESQLKRSEYFEQGGQYKLAYDAYRESHELKDSLNSIQKEKETAQAQALFEVEQKERDLTNARNEISVKDAQLEKERWLRIFGISVTSLLIILMYLLWKRSRQQKILSDQAVHDVQSALQHTREQLEFKEKEHELLVQKLNSENGIDNNHNLKKNIDQSKQDLEDLKVFYDLRKQMQTTITSGSKSSIELNQLRDMVSNLFIEQKHKNLIKDLQYNFPTLSEEDLRLAAAIKQRLLNAEIALFLQVSTNTLYTRKTRLKQKLNLEQENDLNEFIYNYGTAS